MRLHPTQLCAVEKWFFDLMQSADGQALSPAELQKMEFAIRLPEMLREEAKILVGCFGGFNTTMCAVRRGKQYGMDMHSARTNLVS